MKTELPNSTERSSNWEGGTLPPLKLAPISIAYEQQHAWLHPAPVRCPASGQPDATRKARIKQLCLVVWITFFSLVGYYGISRYVITAVEIQGRSMAPTLQDGERYFLNRLAYVWQAPARGDLAVIHDPGHTDCAVKRIVGLPGENIMIRDGGVYVNGRRLPEPYLKPGTQTTMAKLQAKPLLLGPDDYFLLGDNRANSEDSRNYGTVNRSQIIGLISK